MTSKKKWHFFDRLKRSTNFLKSGEELHDALSIPFDIPTSTYWLRVRMQMTLLCMRASLAMRFAPQTADIGKTIGKWSKNPTYQEVIWTTLAVLQETRKPITLSQIEMACPSAKRNSVNDTLKYGVELNLLTRECDGSHPTKLLLEEAAIRVFGRMVHPDIVAFSRAVVMIENMRQNMIVTKESESKDGINLLGRESLFEEMHQEMYDDDINKLKDLKKKNE
mgnify:FL=1